MKNRIITNSLRAIQNTKSRFLPLVIMSFLGVFVFAGLQSTQPDMLKTLDTFLDEHHVYDIQVISTHGLSKTDQESVEKVKGVKETELSYFSDVLLQGQEEEYVLHVLSIPKKINQIDLIEGRLPKNKNEIVVEKNLLNRTSFQLGDSISLASSSLKEDSYQIVGVVESALYFNNTSMGQSRGASSLGAGKIDFYAYLLPESFEMDFFTSLSITVDEASSLQTSTDAYLALIQKVENKVKKVAKERENARYDELLQRLDIELQEKEALFLKNSDFLSNDQKRNALEQLSSLKKMRTELKAPTWYVTDRSDLQTYADYIDDISSVSNLSKIFPLIFFAVSILVSLISMNRMVEEDRVEIGTFKSLGFSNHQILIKYLLFASLATLTGGLLGGLLGVLVIPSLVFNIYGMLFTIPYFQVDINWAILGMSLLISFLCVCGTTLITVLQVVKEKPSSLMRPKSPKKGKRILLENLHFLWNRLHFSSKITIRNLFRYKKRGFVAMIGITGCSALMLCGFGIRDAIIDIASMQYRKIFQFDALVYLSKSSNELLENILSTPSVKKVIPAESKTVEVGRIKGVNCMIFPSQEDLLEVVNLKDKKTDAPLILSDDKVIITDKLADLLELNVGDMIEMTDTFHQHFSFEIAGITKNYLGHSIYMNQETFSKSGEMYQTNFIYLKTKSLTKEEKKNLSKTLLSYENVISISYTTDLIATASDMLKSLNKIVMILIFLSASLSFVVLYNLSNINIEERKREIATLKVLGFYDKEVDQYITRENLIFTTIGILLGLFLGNILTKVVIVTVEIEKARFLHHISMTSYLLTTIITIFFTLLVNFVTHFRLKKIDMISSLKSVD